MLRLLSIIIAICTLLAAISPAMAERGRDDDRGRDRDGDRDHRSYWDRHKSDDEIQTPRGVDIPRSAFLLDKKRADVTGDGERDSIYLIGIKAKRGELFCKETFLLIEDGRTDRFYRVNYKLGGSMGGSLWYGRIDEDRAADIMVTLPTGDSGGLNNYVLLSFRDRRAKFLVDPQRWSEGLKFNVVFRDDFKVKVDSRDWRKDFYIDARRSKDEYVTKGVYGRRGDLKRHETGASDGFSLVQPKQLLGGRFALIGYQAIWGLYHADSLANARSEWKWERGQLRLVDLDILPKR